MNGHGESPGRLEPEPSDDVVEVLARWERSGGHWKVLRADDDWVDVGLFTCDGGEQMARVSGALTSVLRGYLGGRNSSSD